MDMIRQEIGLNEFTDASTPNADALVGIQKNAVMSSNNARQYISDGIRQMIENTARYTSLLLTDISRYNKPAWGKVKEIVGQYNADVIESMNKMYLHLFGIKLREELIESEKQQFKQFLVDAYSKGQIDLSDLIMVWFTKNYKLAIQLFNIKRKKQMAMTQQAEQQGMAFQAQMQQQQDQLKLMLQNMDNQGKVAVAETTGKMANIQQQQKEQGDTMRKLIQELSKHGLQKNELEAAGVV
jgi:hypothetical protein